MLQKVVLFFFIIIALFLLKQTHNIKQTVLSSADVSSYWFLLHRKSQTEELYLGIPGVAKKSHLIKSFMVKVGIPGERPTPLPQLLGKEYWIITEKHEEKDNPAIAPYFLTLNIPASTESPYGPVPYIECKGPASTRGEQCDWVLPGAFGLHGTGGNPEKLSADNPGSSGCIRHSDKDITYLYNLLDPTKEEIRYYIEDN